MQYSHTCIKCSKSYSDGDPDPYYCSSCLVLVKQTAASVDKKLGSTVERSHKSDLQVFDEIQKKTGSKFINIKHLGIKL